MSGWNTEYALDAFAIANRNLDVSPFVKARTLVNRPAFDENAFDRIDRLIASVAADGVYHLNNRAIQSPYEAVGRILRKFDTAGCSEFREVAVGSANLFDPRCGCEIETQTKRYNCANHEGLLDAGRAAFPGLAGEVEAAKRVGFPEINPRTEPVVVVIALLERLACQDSFANGFIAAVVVENETRSELMQPNGLVVTRIGNSC